MGIPLDRYLSNFCPCETQRWFWLYKGGALPRLNGALQVIFQRLGLHVDTNAVPPRVTAGSLGWIATQLGAKHGHMRDRDSVRSEDRRQAL